MTQLLALTEAEVYIFRSRGVFIDVYKADDKIATSGAMSVADIHLWRTYKAGVLNLFKARANMKKVYRLGAMSIPA